ncbi:hypothetical protein C1H46_010522 [Malus baccata]|uniref:Pectinesterase n=1 Tax=Malus baccata TaxID=106549 RepID=A0A540MYI9_MALBA|nr:hypothetical protein C1H46_010522 [Malus baccata]
MVYAYTSMTKVVNPVGWSDDNHPECNNLYEWALVRVICIGAFEGVIPFLPPF